MRQVALVPARPCHRVGSRGDRAACATTRAPHPRTGEAGGEIRGRLVSSLLGTEHGRGDRRPGRCANPRRRRQPDTRRGVVARRSARRRRDGVLRPDTDPRARSASPRLRAPTPRRSRPPPAPWDRWRRTRLLNPSSSTHSPIDLPSRSSGANPRNRRTSVPIPISRRVRRLETTSPPLCDDGAKLVELTEIQPASARHAPQRHRAGCLQLRTVRAHEPTECCLGVVQQHSAVPEIHVVRKIIGIVRLDGRCVGITSACLARRPASPPPSEASRVRPEHPVAVVRDVHGSLGGVGSFGETKHAHQCVRMADAEVGTDRAERRAVSAYAAKCSSAFGTSTSPRLGESTAEPRMEPRLGVAAARRSQALPPPRPRHDPGRSHWRR